MLMEGAKAYVIFNIFQIGGKIHKLHSIRSGKKGAIKLKYPKYARRDKSMQKTGLASATFSKRTFYWTIECIFR